MATITSNTIVKNGMPFIGKILKRTLPYVDQMIITLSFKSDENTIKEVKNIVDPKIEIYWEDVQSKWELTEVENEQINRSKGDWILLLEDDDLWPSKELEKYLSYAKDPGDYLAFSVNPFQLVTWDTYDYDKDDKCYPKLFKKRGASMEKPIPKNILVNSGIKLMGDIPQIKRTECRYFHVPTLKEHSFRNETVWSKYRYKRIKPAKLPEERIEELNTILNEE